MLTHLRSGVDVLATLRVLLIVVVAGFPLWAGKELESHNWFWLAPFLLLTGVLAVVEKLFDRQEGARAQKEIEKVRRRLNLQKERGLSMARLMGVMMPPLKLLDKLTETVAELRKQGNSNEIREIVDGGVKSVNEYIRQLLLAVEEEVRAYWELPENCIKSNLMLAYKIKNCSSEKLNALKSIVEFLAYKRELDSYDTVLELKIWGTTDPQIPPLAVPVEDPTLRGSGERLIPGAPMAYALDKDTVVHDTHRILDFVPEDVEPESKRKLADYFEGKRVRSFMCLILREDARPIGVLNIQSDEINICGPDGQDQTTITKGIEHYRFCLEQLIAGQRKLSASAS